MSVWRVFIAVTLGVILVLSGGNLGGSFAGMLRVALSFFTAPFIYLRDALTGMRNSGADEQSYQRSRVFMMFRWSKLLYLGLLVWCLLSLSSGLTSSLVSLYPSAEIAQGRMLDEQITQLEAQVESANETVASAGAPEFRQQLGRSATRRSPRINGRCKAIQRSCRALRSAGR